MKEDYERQSDLAMDKRKNTVDFWDFINKLKFWEKKGASLNPCPNCRKKMEYIDGVWTLICADCELVLVE